MNDTIRVDVDNQPFFISGKIFKSLFENSHVYYKKEYIKAIENKVIRLKVLQKLAREAHIPYSLFFATESVVEFQLQRNERNLFKGVDNGLISISGRGSVEVRDINLIIKDIRQRQQILRKNYPNEVENKIVGFLRNDRGDVESKAVKISSLLDLDINHLRTLRTKELAYEYLVSLLEENNILVSRCRRGYMPQSINRSAKFSGVVVKDKKFPHIFLYTSDESRVGDPSGRRIFTLLLLVVCAAKMKFTPVTYDSKSKDLIEAEEYRIVEEIIMPRGEFTGAVVNSADEVIDIATECKITPRAALMRLRRLGSITEKDFFSIYQELDDKYMRDSKNDKHPYTARPTTQVLTYCGREFTKRTFELMDGGVLTAGDVMRILLFNKKPKSFLDDLRGVL